MYPNSQKKLLRAVGHKLRPIITIVELHDNIHTELTRALLDHELIKIKVQQNDPKARKDLIALIVAHHQVELIQTIGKVALLYKKAKNPKPKTTNMRFL